MGPICGFLFSHFLAVEEEVCIKKMVIIENIQSLNQNVERYFFFDSFFAKFWVDENS